MTGLSPARTVPCPAHPKKIPCRLMQQGISQHRIFQQGIFQQGIFHNTYPPKSHVYDILCIRFFHNLQTQGKEKGHIQYLQKAGQSCPGRTGNPCFDQRYCDQADGIVGQKSHSHPCHSGLHRNLSSKTFLKNRRIRYTFRNSGPDPQILFQRLLPVFV